MRWQVRIRTNVGRCYILKSGTILLKELPEQLMKLENIYLEKPIYGGQCINRSQGKKSILTYFGIPGEKVSCNIYKEKSDYILADISSIIEPSPDRVTPPCQYFGVCGGCQYQHIIYSRQVDIKRDIVKDTVIRALKKDIPVNDTISSPLPTHYRNNALFKCKGKNLIGFFRHGSHSVVPIDECLIQSEEINEIFRFFLDKDLRGINRVQIRSDSLHKTVIQFALEPHRKGLNFNVDDISKLPGVSGVVCGKRVLFGEDNLTYTIGNKQFIASGYSFFQVNIVVFELIMNKIRDILSAIKPKIAADVYAGVGTIALYTADLVEKMYSIEMSKTSQRDAENNRVHNNITNVEYIHKDAESGLQYILNKRIKPDIIILDPPRAGCSEDVVSLVRKISPAFICYVSCDISTQTRDMRLWLDDGYEIECITPFDMFSQTHHIETLAILRK